MESKDVQREEGITGLVYNPVGWNVRWSWASDSAVRPQHPFILSTCKVDLGILTNSFVLVGLCTVCSPGLEWRFSQQINRTMNFTLPPRCSLVTSLYSLSSPLLRPLTPSILPSKRLYKSGNPRFQIRNIPKLGLRIAIPSREREQGRFRGSIEGA